MKIALVRVNYKAYFLSPPLGLGYLASYAEKFGHEVLIIDALRDNLSNEDVVSRIHAENIQAVGITCLSAFYDEVVDLSKRLKSAGKKVFIGGIHPTFMPKQTLIDTGADYVSLGEGEISLKKLLDADFNGDGIQGVYSLDNLSENSVKGERVENLDDLPMPDWKQMPPDRYPKSGEFCKNYPVGIIATTRGCPFGCKFCASPDFYDRKIRFRSPENVVDEIEYLVKNFGVKEIHFEDDNFTLKRQHAYDICRLIVERKIKISFSCPNGIRAENVDEELFALMKKAGCYSVSYGIESANPEILKNINKEENLDLIKKSISFADKCGIDTVGFFIFGLLGENKQTIERTINYALSLKLSEAKFMIADILPGSELFGEKEPQNAEPQGAGLTRKEFLTQDDLIAAQKRANRKFYFRPQIILKRLRNINFLQMFLIFVQFLSKFLKK